MQKVQLLLKPVLQNSTMTLVEIQQTLCRSYNHNELFTTMEYSKYGCLTSYYNSNEIECYDDTGKLEIIVEEKEKIKYYYFSRKTYGDIHLSYKAKVFEVFNYPNPAYSLHPRNHGATGFGATFLLIPNESCDYTIDYLCDHYCACSYGIGKTKRILDYNTLGSTCFAFNAYSLYHEPDSYFYIVYFEDDLRFFDEIKTKLTMYYNYMHDLFSNKEDPYLIFMYRKEKKYQISLTGTAEENVCLMGYGDELVNSYKDIEATLVHELIHNFIDLKDPEHAYHSLFDEGTADYYSVMIPYILKINTLEETIDQYNKLLKFYYSNPWKERSLKDAYDHGWTHSYAIRISYGKGLLLMIGLDSLLKKYHSSYTLMDLIILHVLNSNIGLLDFIQLIDQEVNGEASIYLDSLLKEGKNILLPGLFDDYQIIEETILLEDNGFDDTVAFSNPKIVVNIDLYSNAYKAGLRNGDILLNKINEWRNGEDDTRIATYQVQRNNQILEISYLPRGKETYCFQFKAKKGRQA